MFRLNAASLLTDVYGHVMIDPALDEWRAFWLGAYERVTRPKRPLPEITPSAHHSST